MTGNRIDFTKNSRLGASLDGIGQVHYSSPSHF